MIEMPLDFKENIKDLKVLGKREVMQVIRYRNKINMKLKKNKKD